MKKQIYYILANNRQPFLLQMQFSWDKNWKKVSLLNFLRRISHLGLFLLIEAYLWDQSLRVR